MRSYEIHDFGPDGLKEVESEVPRPATGEVLVRIRTASLNYRDVMIAAGVYNPRMKLPAVPISDGAGEVVETGEGVTRWNIGDRVSPIVVQKWINGRVDDVNRRTAIGGGAEYPGVLREFALVPESALVAIPDAFSFAEAATFPCAGVTAWNALQVAGQVKPGETVLTLGTGGVSIFAVQIAKMSGARVIATTGSADKEAMLAELGADEVINYRDTEDWDRAVHILTNRAGVDHVVEVGGAGTLSRSVRAVAVGGHVAMIGALSASGDFDPISAFMRSVRLSGIFVGSRQMHEDVLNAFSVNRVKPVIDSVFGFSDVQDAFAKMKSGQHFGKIIIDLDSM